MRARALIYRTFNNYSQAILFYNTVTAITGRATEVIASQRGMVRSRRRPYTWTNDGANGSILLV